MHPVLRTNLSSPHMQKELASTEGITRITKCILRNKTDPLENGYCGYTSRMEETENMYIFTFIYAGWFWLG